MLEGTGGIADHIEELLTVINKESGARIIYNSDPIKLVELLEQAYLDLVESHETDWQLE